MVNATIRSSRKRICRKPMEGEGSRTNSLTINCAAAATSRTSFHSKFRLGSMLSCVALLVLFMMSPKVSGENEFDNYKNDLSGTDPQPRIIGGTEIAAPSVPYFVWLNGCAATLIHNDIGLSAAHCSTRSSAQLGIQQRDVDVADSNSKTTRVDRVERHPEYDDNTYDYDFAVIKFSGWFQQGLVHLNRSESFPSAGDGLTILGFDGQSQTLSQGKVNYVDPLECSLAWGEFGYEIREEIVLCAADLAFGVDACTGDSGGPLLDGQVQVGVISSGSGCNGLLPTTYSRVSAAIDWIEGQICDLSDFPPDGCARGGAPPSGVTRIRVDIVLDDYPEDIEWRIQRDSVEGPVVASGGGYNVAHALESTFVDLEDGVYLFTINDQSGFADGLGGRGSYTVVEVNGQGNDARTLVSGGDNFSELESSVLSIAGGLITSSPTITTAPSLSITSTPQPSLRPITQSPSIQQVTAAPTDSPTIEVTAPRTNEPTVQPVAPSSPTDEPDEESETTEPMDSPEVEPDEEPETTEPMDSPEVETDEPVESPVDDGDRRELQDETPEPTEAEPIEAEPTEAEPIEAEPTEAEPTEAPIDPSTEKPTETPTSQPATLEPMAEPTAEPASETTAVPTAELTAVPSEEPTAVPAAVPSESEEPSQEPTSTDPPSDFPSDFPSASPSTSVMPSLNPPIPAIPTAIPTELAPPVSESPSMSPSPTASPTAQPNVSLDPTNASSESPTTSSASLAPSSSFTPSVVPTTTDAASEAPTTPLERYLIAVSVMIISGPTDISWRVVDFETQQQEFGYAAGWYQTTGFSLSTVLLQTGRWEWILARSSSTAAAIVEFGILNSETGQIETIDTLNLAESGGDAVITSVFSLD